MSALNPGLRNCVVLVMVIAAVALLTSCGPDPGETASTTRAGALSDLAILPTLEFTNAPQVILAAAKDFQQLCFEAEVDRVLGRMDPGTGVWMEFAVVIDGVFYVLPALGYHTPYDRFDGERLKMPTAKVYYTLQQRERQEYRFHHYFVE